MTVNAGVGAAGFSSLALARSGMARARAKHRVAPAAATTGTGGRRRRVGIIVGRLQVKLRSVSKLQYDTRAGRYLPAQFVRMEAGLYKGILLKGEAGEQEREAGKVKFVRCNK
ncbi:hypothetical protein GCM10027317_43520 [Massilia agri]